MSSAFGEWMLIATLLACGLIHLLPVAGVLGGQWLDKLYGVTVKAPDLLILMRHRAILFGLIGAALIAAAMVPGLRIIAAIFGLISMLAFVWLAFGVETSAQIRRVVWIDVVLSVLLGVALVLRLLFSRDGAA